MKLYIYFISLCILSCSNKQYKKNDSISNIESVDVRKTSINDSIHDIELNGFFDYDNLEDKLFCNLILGEGEPFYSCNAKFGNRKEVRFEIPISSSSLQIDHCGNGCIETYEWITGTDGYEETNVYLYDKELGNWFQQTNSIQENGVVKIKNYDNEQWSIDFLILKIKNKKTYCHYMKISLICSNPNPMMKLKH